MRAYTFCSIIVAVVLASAVSPRGAEGGVVAEGARIERLAGGFKFTEGPACDAQGNVYFTDQPNNRIMKWSVDGELSVYLEPCGRANGLYFDRKGNLLACADERNELWSIHPDKEVEVLASGYEGKLFNGPNDLWVRPDNGVYFTDPFYRRPYWERGPIEQDGRHVYFLSADRARLRRVTDDLEQPNGIVGAPDGRSLYVADIGAGRTFVYDIQEDGTLARKRLFCEMGSDGMTLDSEGNVYLTGRGVTVFNSEGAQIDHIDVPERWTANVCFGGPERRALFITASEGLYRIQTRTRGAGAGASN